MRVITTSHPKLERVVITGDNKFLLVGGGGQLSLIALDDPTHKAIRIPGSIGIVHAIWTSPDGKRAILATEKNSNFQFVHLDVINKKVAKTASAPMLIGGSFSSDGAVFAVGFPDEIKQLETRTGREIFSIPATAIAGRLVYSKSGRHLALFYFGVLSLFDATTGQELERGETGARHGCALDVSPDNCLVAIACLSEDVENPQPVLIYRIPSLGP